MKDTLLIPVLSLALVAGAFVPVRAADKEQRQMMADLRMLQEQQQQIQNAVMALTETLKTVDVRLGKRLDDQARRRGRTRHRDIVERFRQRTYGHGDHMHAAQIGRDLQQPVEMTRRGLQQLFAAAGIELTRATQVSGEMTIGDEPRQCTLAQQRCAHRDAVHDPFGGLDQRGGQHEKAQPERGEEQLGEAAEIGNAAGAIERA